MQKIINFFSNFEEFDEKKVFWTAFWISVVVMLLHIFFFHKVERDFYYTAMAREFGDGRYQYAFFAAIPPLLSVLAGSIMKIGISAFTAVKTVSAFFYIAGLFPFRALMKRIIGNKLAAWACIVYVCSSYPIRYSVFGFPFALKMFFLILSAYLVIKFAETLKIRYSIYLGFSLGLLALARGECIGFLPFYVLWFLLLPIYLSLRSKKNNIKTIAGKQVIGIFLIIICFIAICWPQMIFIYNRTGVPFTEARTASILKDQIEKVINIKLPAPKYKLSSGVQTTDHIFSYNIRENGKYNSEIIGNNKSINIKNKGENVSKEKVIKIKPKDSYDIPSTARNLKEAYKGLYAILIIFALIGLFCKFKDKEFKIYDLFFFSIIFYNAVMFLTTIAVTKRYTAVTQPFEFGWVALGGYYIYSWDKWKICPKHLKQYWKFITGVAATVVLFILLINGFNRFNEELFEGNPYRTVGLWIRDHKEQFPGNKFIKVNNFHTNRLPVIFDALPEYTFWAEGDHLPIGGRYSYSYKDIVYYMKNHNATVMIYDDRMKEICPTFLKYWTKDFNLIKDFKNLNVKIFRLRN